MVYSKRSLGSVTVCLGFFLCFDIGLRGMLLSFLHAQHTSQPQRFVAVLGTA